MFFREHSYDASGHSTNQLSHSRHRRTEDWRIDLLHMEGTGTPRSIADPVRMSSGALTQLAIEFDARTELEPDVVLAWRRSCGKRVVALHLNQVPQIVDKLVGTFGVLAAHG
jgi:hypothetical protein